MTRTPKGNSNHNRQASSSPLRKDHRSRNRSIQASMDPEFDSRSQCMYRDDRYRPKGEEKRSTRNGIREETEEILEERERRGEKEGRREGDKGERGGGGGRGGGSKYLSTRAGAIVCAGAGVAARRGSRTVILLRGTIVNRCVARIALGGGELGGGRR